MKRDDDAWAILLAGGDGVRLRSLTRSITGDARPKQFCPLVDGETLLDRTRRRAELLVRPDRHVIVVTRDHQRFYAPFEGDLSPGRLVVQPANRGTAPGILYPVLRIEDLAGDPPVVIMPSDHDVVDEVGFARHVAAALDLARALPDRVILLGMEPEAPEAEYGWIETFPTPLDAGGEPVFAVHRFWEKPMPALARALFERGCIWNSFVMAGRVSAFRELLRRALPALHEAFEPLRRRIGSRRESALAQRVYRSIGDTSFSEQVLTRATDRLAAMRVKNVGWCDLGTPARVAASLLRRGSRPAWPGATGLASTA